MKFKPIWPNGARLALSLVINVEEGAERSVADGDTRAEAVDEMGLTVKPGIRNLSNESNYAYGINAGAPRIFDMLSQRGLKATFASAAQSLEKAPEVARRISDGKHETCAHGYRWLTQHNMDVKEERNFIKRASQSIEQTTGTTSSATVPTSKHSPKMPCDKEVVIEGFQGTSASLIRSHVKVSSWPTGWEPGPNGWSKVRPSSNSNSENVSDGCGNYITSI